VWGRRRGAGTWAGSTLWPRGGGARDGRGAVQEMEDGEETTPDVEAGEEAEHGEETAPVASQRRRRKRSARG
jgi:hypothetical protein